MITRRDALKVTAATAVTASVELNLGSASEAVAAPMAFQDSVSTSLKINGVDHTFAHDPRVSLLDALREMAHLFGTKKGCDHGQCGACTVHVDGRRVVSCLMPLAQLEEREVTTIEGIAGPDGVLHPLQQAFIDHDALQCGYCTPGQIMAGIACIKEGHATSPAEIREFMSGNLCRCGAYVGIVAAIADAREKMGG
ncbi:xanthine dehydrogenase YagT iron-sulfur-binding subunit [Rhizobium sp. BE258]|jgi:xanthine dehydrogenase YagT iron-sulfur-binding subunit|nr:xanthine dehydrogenase YagT iron-sulfur-binding subunit [Rhizobium sp. BE258]